MERKYKGASKEAYVQALAKLEALKAAYENKAKNASTISMLNKEIQTLKLTLENWDTLSHEETPE